MQIRPVRSEDWPGVLDLYFRGLSDELALVSRIMPGKMVNFSARLDSENLLKLICQNGSGQIFVAEENGVVAGYTLMTRKEYLAEIPSQIGCVNGVFVAENFRRRGLGKKLYEAGVTWLKSHGITLIELYHMINDPGAEAFWASLGFVPVQVNRMVKI